MDILVIPDTQVKFGVNTDHIKAAGNYIVEHQPEYIVHMGDHWDMPALNRFATSLEAEGNKLWLDMHSGNEAMRELLEPLREYNAKAKIQKKKRYKPKLIYIVGNHDPQVRIPRLIEENPILEDFIEDKTTEFLEELGFEVIPFLQIKVIEDIRFSHFFVNVHSAKKSPLGGQIDTMMKNAGFSFVQGHTQTFKSGKHYLADGTERIGIVGGAFYSHDEKYMGPQGNHHWRGLIHLKDVKNGGATINEISLENLIRDY
jgi:predicted phosphodiesterase